MSGSTDVYEERADSAAANGKDNLQRVREMLTSVGSFHGSVKVAMIRQTIVSLEDLCKRLEYAASCLEKAVEREASNA